MFANKLKKSLLSAYIIFTLITAGFIGLMVYEGVMDHPGVTAAPVTYIVNQNGTGDFSKIQDAINNATNGSTIYVWEGIYFENVIVNRTLTIIGNSSTNTSISAEGLGGDVVYVDSDWVNISGLMINKSGNGGGDTGIELDNVQNCHIEYCNFSNNYNGIKTVQSNKNIFNNNYYYKNSNAGIRLESFFGLNNTICNNTFNDNQYGIYVDQTPGNTIFNNTFIGNDWYDIYATSSLDNVIEDNTFSGSSVFAGIWLTSTKNTFIYNNTLSSKGIVILGNSVEHWNTHTIPTNNTVNGKPFYYWKNAFSGNTPAGAGQVVLANCSYVTVENLDINTCSKGVQLGFSNEITVQNNTISSNGWGSGIELYQSYDCDIINNTCSNNNNGNGIDLEYSSADLSNNTCNNNEYSIKLTNSDYSTIIGNDGTNNNYGLHLISSSNNNTVSQNTFASNSNGIYIGWSSYNSFDNNVMASSINHGIYVLNSYKNDFYKDNCTDNSAYQLFEENSENNTYDDCIFYALTDDGVNLTNSVDVKIMRSNITTTPTYNSLELDKGSKVYMQDTVFDNTTVYYADENSTLTVQYFLDIEVCDQSLLTPISGAKIEVLNKTDYLMGTYFTLANGWVNDIVTTHYVGWDNNSDHDDQDLDEHTFHSPHSIQISKPGFKTSYINTTMNKSKTFTDYLEKIPTTYNNWNLTDSPINVTSNLTVEINEVLVIEPGVEINMSHGTYIEVFGRIYCNGTLAQPIVFQANHTTPGWGFWDGIYLRSDENSFKHTGISNSNVSFYIHGNTSTTLQNNLIDNCTLTNSSQVGIYMEYANDNEFRNTTFYNNYKHFEMQNSNNNYFYDSYFSESLNYGLKMLASNYNKFYNTSYYHGHNGNVVLVSSSYNEFYYGHNNDSTSDGNLLVLNGSMVNSFKYINFTHTGSIKAIYIGDADNNTFDKCDFYTPVWDSIFVSGSNNIVIRSSDIITNPAKYSIRLNSGSNVTVEDTTFDNSTVYYYDVNSVLYIKNHLEIEVLDDTLFTPIDNVAVELRDNFLNSLGTYYTIGNGRVNETIVTTLYSGQDKNADGDDKDAAERVYYSPHNITCSKTGYYTKYLNPYIYQSQLLTVYLKKLPPPNFYYWNLTDSPIFIEDNMTLAVNDKLYIQAGVEVNISRGITFTVYGQVFCYGDIANPIVFQPNETTSEAGYWESIILRSDGNILNYTNVIGANYSVIIDNCDYNTIMYCNFEQTSNDTISIIDYSYDNMVQNTTITDSGRYGLYLNWAYWNDFYALTIDNTTSNGIMMENSYYNEFLDIVVFNSTLGHGVCLKNNTYSNTFYNVNSANNNQSALWINGSWSDTFIYCDLNGFGNTYAVNITYTDNIVLEGCEIQNIAPFNTQIGMYSYVNLTVVNCNFDNESVWFNDSNSKITLKYYLRVYVQNINLQPVEGATVVVKDKYHQNSSTSKTDFQGYTGDLHVYFYTGWDSNADHTDLDSGERTYYSPHNITVNKFGYKTAFADPEPTMNMTKEVPVTIKTLSNNNTITLTKAGSPYYFNEDFTVSAGEILRIEPGAVLRLAPNIGITVYGKVYSNGTQAEPIQIICNSSNDTWDSFDVYGNQSSFKYTIFNYSYSGLQLMQDDGHFVYNCKFENFTYYGLHIYDSELNSVIECAFTGDGSSAYAIKLYSSYRNTFSSNTISSVEYGIYLYNSNINDFHDIKINSVMYYGIYLDTSKENTFDLTDVMDVTMGSAVYFDWFSPDNTLINSTFNQTMDSVIAVYSNTGILIDNCIISNQYETSLIYIANSSSVEIRHSELNHKLDVNNTNIELGDNSYCKLYNTSFNGSAVKFLDTGSLLEVEYYMDIYVEDDLSAPVAAATVTVYNSTMAQVFSGSTDSGGYIFNITLKYYLEDSVGTEYHTPHNVTVTKANHATTYAEPLPYMDRKRFVTVTLERITIDFIIIEDAPGGGGNNVSGTHYNLAESDTYYAAGYSNKFGYVSSVSVNWVSSATNIATVTPSSGTQTVLSISSVNFGTVRITASTTGLSSFVDIVVDQPPAPTLDYIVIQTTLDAAGVPIGDRTYDLGGTDTFYCVGYNDSSGFIGPVQANWLVLNTSLGGLIPTTTSNNTVFTASTSNYGSTQVQATYLSMTDLTGTLTVNAPVIDRIQIERASGGNQPWVSSGTYTVDDTDIFYCVGYNTTYGFVSAVNAAWTTTYPSIGTVTTPGNNTVFTAVSEGTVKVEAFYNTLVNTSGPLLVNPKPEPGPLDFDFTAQITVTPSGPVLEDSTVNITITVFNNGLDLAQNVLVRLYDIEPGDKSTTLLSEETIISLASSGTSILGYTSPPLKPGPYTFIVIVDPVDVIAETNETNNMANTTLTVLTLEEWIVSIEITPSTWTMTADDTMIFTVVGIGRDANYYDIDPTWSVNGGGDIDSDGLFMANLVGDWEVYADYGIVRGTAQVTITPGQLKAIKISYTKNIFEVGEKYKFNITGYDSDSNEVTIPSAVTWEVNASVTSSIGDIDDNGTFTATGEGAGRIIANVTVNNQVISDELDILVKLNVYYEKEYDVTPENGTVKIKIHIAFDDEEGNVTFDYLGEEDIYVEGDITKESFGDQFTHIGVFVKIEMPAEVVWDWIIIECEYDPALLPGDVPEKDLLLFYFDEAQDKWVRCENTWVDTVNNIVYANVTHLTIFAPMAESGGGKTTPDGDGDKDDTAKTSAGMNLMVILALIATVIVLALAAGVIIIRKRRATPIEKADEEVEEEEEQPPEPQPPEKEPAKGKPKPPEKEVKVSLAELEVITKSCPGCKTPIKIKRTREDMIHLQCTGCGKKGRMPNPYLPEIEKLLEKKRKEAEKKKKGKGKKPGKGRRKLEEEYVEPEELEDDIEPVEIECPECEKTLEIPFSTKAKKIVFGCDKCDSYISIKNPYLDLIKEKAEKEKAKPSKPKDKKAPKKDEKPEKKEVEKPKEEEEEDDDESIDFDSLDKDDDYDEDIFDDAEEEKGFDFDLTDDK